MLIRITLTPDDRERLGCPETLEYDPTRVMVDEVEAIQDDAGIDPADWPTAQQTWLEALAAGFKTLDSAGQRTALRAERAVVWISLRRVGIRVPLGELSYNRNGLKFDFPDVPDGSGKGPLSTPPGDSPTAEPS